MANESECDRLTYLLKAGPAGNQLMRYSMKIGGVIMTAKLSEFEPPLVQMMEELEGQAKKEAFERLLLDISTVIDVDPMRLFVETTTLSVLCSFPIREYYERMQISFEEAAEALALQFGSYNHVVNTLKVEDFKVYIPNPEDEALLEADAVQFALYHAGETWDEFNGVLSTNAWISRMTRKSSDNNAALDPLLIPLTWKSLLQCVDVDNRNKKFYGSKTFETIPDSLEERKNLPVFDINVLRGRGGSWFELFHKHTQEILTDKKKLLTGRWVFLGGFLHCMASLGLVPASRLDNHSMDQAGILGSLFGLEDWNPPDIYVVAEVRELLNRFFHRLPKISEEATPPDSAQAWRVVTCVFLEFLAENVFDASAEWYFAKCETVKNGVSINMGVDVGYALKLLQ